MSKECPNFQCKDYSGARTILPSEANFCFVCGNAVSEKAMEKQAKKLKSIRSRKLNDANNEIAVLETKLKENERSVTELEKIKKENQALITQLLSENILPTRLEDDIEKEKEETKQWPLIIILTLFMSILIFVLIFFHA